MLSLLRRLRAHLPLDWDQQLQLEYTLRRWGYRLMGYKNRSPHDLILHCCTWKTGSQWVRLMLSDPAVFKYTGHLPATGAEAEASEASSMLLHSGRIYTACYADHAKCMKAIGKRSYRIIYVVRDPRDIVVSDYFSKTSSHIPHEVINTWRGDAALNDPSIGLPRLIEKFGPAAQVINGWLDAADVDPNIRVFRYEDLIGGQKAETWMQIFEWIGAPLLRQDVEQLLTRYSFETLSGGRKPGVEDRSNKYRKGTPGDWVNHLDPAMLAALDAVSSGLPGRLGYGAPEGKQVAA